MQSKDAVAVANTIQHLLVPGGKAIVVSADAKHRFGVDRFESECLRVGLQITISNIADMYNGQLLPSKKFSLRLQIWVQAAYPLSFF